ncbi:MAG: hypothetical protein M3Z09_13600, partial [Acidobacteriota bacterium]|nr:hypothetical protein [Acidobacteriota bacterium]
SDTSSNEKLVALTGTVSQIDDKSLVLEETDTRILTCKLVSSTKLPAQKINPGDRVRISARQDAEAFLTAATVEVDSSAKSGATLPASAPVVTASDPPSATAAPPTPDPVIYKPAKKDPDDGGPPHLRYGKPKPRPYTEPAEETAAASAPSIPAPRASEGAAPDDSPKPAPVKQDLIERAREWALNFTAALPNYVCQQFTTRYLRNPGSRDWQAKDVVSANVIYENGKEDYRNIAINGKTVSKKMEELPGSWSTGEFGTTLRSLFHPRRQTAFRFVKQSQMSGMTASVYDYSVKRENSDWRVQLGSQAIIPAYSGRVWIDAKTARVLRIEMQAEEIPEAFPLDKVESTNDYALVRLAAADEFLLPVHAETLSCERGTTFCSRNAIEFRNYHKYSGEANITFQ